MVETLERRFDSGFGISRSEAEYNQRVSDRVQQLEANLTRQERDCFEMLLREKNIDPWQ